MADYSCVTNAAGRLTSVSCRTILAASLCALQKVMGLGENVCKCTNKAEVSHVSVGKCLKKTTKFTKTAHNCGTV